MNQQRISSGSVEKYAQLSIDHVALHVIDLQHSGNFFEHVLRLEPISRPAFSFDGKWYRLSAGQELHLIRRDPAPRTQVDRDDHFALLVDDINEWQQHLVSIGVEHAPPKQRPDGAHQIFLQDPDGHFIELCTRPESGS